MRKDAGEALEDLLQGEAGQDRGGEVGALVELAERLSALKAVGPDPSFRSALKERLLREAGVLQEEVGVFPGAPVPAPSPAPRTPLRARPSERALALRPARVLAWFSRTRVALALGSALMLLLSGLALVTVEASPASPLYLLRARMEEARGAAIRDPAKRGVFLLSLARKRLMEAERLAGGISWGASHGPLAAGLKGPLTLSGAPLAGLERALSVMDAETEAGARLVITAYLRTGREEVLVPLRDFLIQQRAGLERLSSALAGPATQAITRSLALLERISARVRALEGGSCTGCAAPEELAEIKPPPAPFKPCPCPAPSRLATTPSPQPSPSPLPSPAPESSPSPSPTPPPSPQPTPRPNEDWVDVNLPGPLHPLGEVVQDLLNGVLGQVLPPPPSPLPVPPNLPGLPPPTPIP